jgi:amidase
MTTTAGTTTELWRLGAVELAAAIRARRVSSREVVEAHLRRIEAVNPAVNAVTVVLAERAMEAAEAADQAATTGVELAPFHGVPFTVKESIDLTGTATTLGIRLLVEAYPDRDAPIVERMRAAGAIPIGRTNCPDLAVRWHTDSELWGATVNPWDRARTPGASSGGEAVALATGMSPLGLGSDGLGSLRWPAQCCGITALKPTLGRLPNATTLEPADAAIGVQLTAVTGPMARRVADLRAALEVLAGPTWRDPWTVPAPLHGADLAHPVGVALVADPAGQGVDGSVQNGVQAAGRALEDAGYAVEEVEPPAIEDAARILLQMLNTPDVRALWQTMTPVLPVDTQRFFAAFYEVAGDPDPVVTLQSFVARASLLRAWGEFQEHHPLIVAPICTEMPFGAGADLEDGRVAETIHGMRMALAVNTLGLPAVALPVGTAGGLPLAVQIIGPRYREDLCLDAAAAIEERLGVLAPIDPR